MSKKVLVLLADGFEEVEAITPIDYLKRAGLAVVTASIGNSTTVTGARAELKVIADTTLEELSPGTICYDAVVLPGGMTGASNLASCNQLTNYLIEMNSQNKLICAICASPAIVLAPLGILKDKKFTCYPGMEEKVSGAKHSNERVVVDGNIITSQAAGTTGEFSIAIIRALLNDQIAKKISDSILL